MSPQGVWEREKEGKERRRGMEGGMEESRREKGREETKVEFTHIKHKTTLP